MTCKPKKNKKVLKECKTAKFKKQAILKLLHSKSQSALAFHRVYCPKWSMGTLSRNEIVIAVKRAFRKKRLRSLKR